MSVGQERARTFVRAPVLADTAVLAQARSFLRVAHTGLDGTLLTSYHPDETPEVDERNLARLGSRTYWFTSGVVSVDVRSGRITSYGIAGTDFPTHVYNENGSVYPRRVSDEDALDLAQRFYNAAGYSGRIALDPITKIGAINDLQGNNDSDVEVRYVRMVGDVPYLSLFSQGVIRIDRETGRLDGFSLPPDRPEAPASLKPNGNLTEARLAALRTAFAWRGEALSEDPSYPFRLCLWSRSLEFGPRNGASRTVARALGPEHRSALAAHRALLAYKGILSDASGRSIEIVLDAHTGRAIEMVEVAGRGTLGGTASTPRSSPLAVPASARPWRVATGGAGWKAWSAPADAALVPTTGAAPKGVKLVLSDGRLALAATYEPKTNLLGIDGKAYRPGPALANLLRKRTKEGTRSGTPPRTSKP